MKLLPLLLLLLSPAALGATAISDTFTDANGVELVSHTPDTDEVGGGWQNIGLGCATNECEIQNNQLHLTNAFNTLFINSGQTSYTINVTWVTAQRSIRVFFRCDGTDPGIFAGGTGDCWWLETDLLDANELQLYRADDGSNTDNLVASQSLDGMTGGEVIEVAVTESSIAVSVDSVQQIFVNSSTYSTLTYVGLGEGPGTGLDVLDTFSVTYAGVDVANCTPLNPSFPGTAGTTGDTSTTAPCSKATIPDFNYTVGQSITTWCPDFYIFGCEAGGFTYTLPTGISLTTNANGRECFTGAPISAGSMAASVTCANASGSGTQYFAVNTSGGGPAPTVATGYFIDPDGGSDGNAGTSYDQAWQTCGQINVATITTGNINILSGAVADCTTAASIALDWSGFEIRPYYVDAGVPYEGLNGNSRPVIRSTSTTARPVIASGANGLITEVCTDWDTVTSAPGNIWDIRVTGNGVTVDSACGSGDADSDASWTLRQAGVRRGWVEVAADNVTINGNDLGSYSLQTIRVQEGSQYWRITNNEGLDTWDDSIRVNTDGNTPQYGLVANNRVTCGRVGDAFQTNNSTFGGPAADNYNITVRNNEFTGSASAGGTCENLTDVKGATSFWIMENVGYGSQGDNNGSDQDGPDRNSRAAMTRGSGSGNATRVRYNRNIVYDAGTGISVHNDSLAWGNTLVSNNRDYTGPQSTLPDGEEHYNGVSSAGTDSQVLNNIIMSHQSCEMSLNFLDNAPAKIDGNLYWDVDGVPCWHDDSFGVDTKTTSFTTWKGWLSGDGIAGADANGQVANPNLPAGLNPLSGTSVAQFLPPAGSPAIDAGIAVATTTASGTATTTITLTNSCFFYGGNGIPNELGWLISIGGDPPTRVQSSGCEDPTAPVTTTLIVEDPQTYGPGEAVWRVDASGNRYNDRGACETNAEGCPVVGPQ